MQVLMHLQRSVGSTTLRELAEAIAEEETGESPPPTNIRESVYNSLHQTHLPKLDQYEIIEYDSDRKTIHLNERSRSVDPYMNVVMACGLTWSEFYRTLGTVSLFLVLAALIDFPIVSAVDPLVWTTLFLFVFAVSMAYQVWTHRWRYLNALLNRSGAQL